MPDQIEKGYVFVDGNVVNAALLNALVDEATAQPGIISEQGTVVPATGTDQVLINRAGVLHRANVSSLPTGVTEVSATALPATVFGVSVTVPAAGEKRINLTLDQKHPNQFLASDPSGAALGTPDFREIVPADTILFREVAAHAIDCTLGNVFRKVLHANETLKLNNGALGQKITVYLIQGDAPGNFTVTWSSDDVGHVIRWPGSVEHHMTTGLIGVTDIVNFLCMGSGLYYGTFDKDFVP